jgi:Complex1_LYR-like
MTMASNGPVAAKSLYRSLLRAHARHLPDEIRQLGDTYVKAEFRLHRNAKPEQATLFFAEWSKYLNQIRMVARVKEAIESGSLDHSKANPEVYSFGKDLPPDLELTDEQKSQLEKLREEATKS